ncbi:gremlin-2-like [Orbicella faveolata]|uniref:gremlin-2-like n=1 Tax=Orbicella faveolata TaxID=48498 RepID=UPI0009E3F00C|nr:gremlin-2-like [Orbicella faveolata]
MNCYIFSLSPAKKAKHESEELLFSKVVTSFFLANSVFLTIFNMQASESGRLSFATLVTLMLMASQASTTKASGLQQLLKSNAGTELSLSGQDIEQPWCRMKPLPQKVRRRGCETATIMNNLCYGQCRSFYVPHRKGYFESCSFCTPINSTTENVVLSCPSKTKKQVVKKVKIITACSCRVCGQKYI